MFNALGKVRALRCSCDLFASKGGCRHTDWVSKNLADEIAPHLTSKTLLSPTAWRDEVLESRRVEVI